jgi:multidrug efflux pump subunit AcrA (membrane-fusion protein)
VLLALVACGLAVAGVLELGAPSSSARTSRELVTAAKGVVQSTVSGSGNVEPGTDVEANFQTSGTLEHLYVAVGDHVTKGQLIATLDPTAAQNTLDQAEENLTSAEDNLTNAEEATVTTTTSRPVAASSAEYVALDPTPTTTTSASTTTTPAQVTTTVTVPSTTTATTTTGSPSGRGSTNATRSGSSGSSGSSSSSSSSGSSGSTSSGETAAEKAANIASARASVDGAEATVTTDETALRETHLHAPASGTVVSVESISPGDAVSGSSSGSSASSSSGSSASSSGSSGSSSSSAGSLGATSSSSTSGTSSSSGLVEIVNTSKLTMTVAFSESDVSKIKVGQAATVTLDALANVKLAAHVSSISTLGTTSSSVVSYDATLTIDQHDSQVKPGMSASAAVITDEATGVTLASSAVPGTGTVSTVNVLRNGKTVPTRVVVGLRGDTRTQIVSGLSAGAEVVVTTTLPSLSSTATGSSATSGTLGGATTGRRFGGGGFGGGGFSGGGGGFAGGAGGG